MAPDTKVKEMKSTDAGALLDAGDGAVVTLMAGDTQLAAHRAVLKARSPVFKAMFRHDTLEASSGRVTITDVEGPVLRQLLAYCYTLNDLQPPSMALQLLVAADKYGLVGLKTRCEQQAAANLAVENAAEAAVLAVRHSCQDLTAAAVAYIKDHLVDVMSTEGWADMMRNRTEDLIRVSKLLAKPPTGTRSNTIAPDMKNKEKSARDLAALLDAGDGAMVTLVAGDTQLAAHRAVLAAMSPVFEDMFQHKSLESSSGRVTITDLEGPVLRQLLAYCYTLNAPRLAHMASQLLAAAAKYGLSGLKTECEQQMVADLFVENVAAAAVLAVRHSCPSLTQAALTFIKAHFLHVAGTKGWADAMRNQPEYLIEVSRLLAEPPPEIRIDTMAPDTKVKETKATDAGALLDAGDGAVVTLVAGDTQLAAHRAVLRARSPVFEAMFRHDTLEASSGQVTITDIEGPVLQQLLAYCYTLQDLHPPSMALQLLVAADKYGLVDLKTRCEQQAAANLAVENAAEAAVLAVRHSCQDLTAAAVTYLKDHLVDVASTEGWTDMMRNQTELLIRVSQLLAKSPTGTRTDSIAPDMKIMEKSARDLAAILDAGDGAMVTLVAGDTQLAAHRAVLAAMSPVFEEMFQNKSLESSTDRVTITDIEGPVLRQLLAYCYTSNAPRLGQMASQLLAAADKYGLTSLKTECEQQMVADLFVGNVAAAAVLAVRHSCPSLTQAALTFIKAHFLHVVATKGWADAMRNQPEYLIEVSRLLAEPPSEIRRLSGEEKGKKLIQAAKDGSWEQVQMLMTAGADVGLRDGSDWNWTPLHWAARYGHTEAVRCLLDSGAEVDSTGLSQCTPLHTSAYNGHTAVVQLLVASSAAPNLKDVYGRTALHWAAVSGRAEVVAVLLEVGADKEIRDIQKKSPLDLATEKNHQKVIELLT